MRNRNSSERNYPKSHYWNVSHVDARGKTIHTLEMGTEAEIRAMVRGLKGVIYRPARKI